MAKSKVKTTQTVLATFFMVSMLIGFSAVAYIDYEYQQNSEPVILFESDSDADTFKIDLPQSTYPIGQFYDSQNSQMAIQGTEYIQWNRTNVYTGNNTWAMGINGTGYDNNYIRMQFALPNLEDWIITSVNFTSTLSGDDIESYGVVIIHSESSITTYDSSQGTLVYQNTGITTETELDINQAVPTNLGLRIHDYAIEPLNDATGIEFFIYMEDMADSWSFEIDLEIWGEQISNWALSDSIFGALAGATTLNVLVMLYMNDSIDIGGFSKTLKKKRW